MNIIRNWVKQTLDKWIQKKRGNKQILLFIGTFILGMLIVYGLGLLRIHEIFSHHWEFAALKNWLIQVSSFFMSFSPSLGFVSDVIAYQAAIIAIAIPLSLEIISRISERYQSGVITKEFNRQWQLKVLLVLVIANALSGVTLKFFVDSKIDAGWKILAWLIFLLFLVTNILLFAFFNMLRQYATKTKFLLDRLFDDLNQVLRPVTINRQMSDKALQQYQEEFISALEGIGDILVFETKNRKNSQYIIESLKQIHEISEKFFALQNSHSENFEKLLYSHEILQLHKPSSQLEVSPEKYLVALMAIVNQFLRIHEAAQEIKNYEIANLSLRNLIWLLRDLSQQMNHDHSIRTLLQVLADLRYNNRQIQDELTYELYVTVYTKVVFQKYFNLRYLRAFDRYFYDGIGEIISSGKTQIFEQLVSILHDESEFIKLQYTNQNPIESLQNFLRQINYELYQELAQTKQLGKKLKYLKFSVGQLWTQEQLNQCLELFKEVQDIIHRGFQYQEEIQNQLSTIYRNVEFRFKFNNLIYLIFNVGAYCIFKNRYDYIYFKQPHDADATWLGYDIIPGSLLGLFNFYFQNPFGSTISSENHHGGSQYSDQYFLILLLREFLNSQVTTNQARQNIVNTFQIPNDINSRILSNIPYKVNHLIPIARELINLSESLQILNFDINQLNDAIEYGLIVFLDSLKIKADEQLEKQVHSQKISNTKVEEFKSEFLKGYNEIASLRYLFNHFGLYEDRTHEIGDINLNLFKLNKIDEKPIFFDEWYVDYGNLGFFYGKDLANLENAELIVKILKHCHLRENITLDNIINIASNGNDINNLLIIGVNASFDNFLYDYARFKVKGIDGETDINIPEFLGSYIYGNYKIPVFNYFCNRIPTEEGFPEQAILVIDRNHLGKLVQYAPVTADEPYHIKEQFAFRISAFSEDEMLMNESLQQPSDFVVAQGDETQQRAYLETQVLIRIYEKFTLEIDPNFSGYLIPESDFD
ncbi:hypothetical protein B6N60_01203 [Richelia sinica FACHB-800]|uniref:Uncharacterized protein n=1 Tax=Richelia sinica FACHB-800 TaxID=1357546 RepID=A0A975T5Y7_9NOST|nr:hypothetical protein [Richelia sinica]MBD2664256.1 hypothetical protein [Richelia sinica FACHB-800]QXE22520.1 hypothetical protein B6N60_01203 [Richelia sinica FACHB-800]